MCRNKYRPVHGDGSSSLMAHVQYFFTEYCYNVQCTVHMILRYDMYCILSQLISSIPFFELMEQFIALSNTLLNINYITYSLCTTVVLKQ